ncbi:hypothetical protein [Paenibacillus nasutitermitis]|uniref:Uncharacterized protein n=1 Tax=Paenibacillus nasutitermitis TaxID=1652958 RepID=A0A916YL12_9BACL|nr:hypothetical protein [Paenibacillus nasutitermitis]GGD49682.1 hypothetical protein GCM10010911_03990 [Paenibacillus nasutitermitis]
MLPDFYINRQKFPLHFSSVIVRSDRSLVAASPGQGIFLKCGNEVWRLLSDGLPEGTAVNRLQMSGGVTYACTNKGLFRLKTTEWQVEEVGHPCYQYKEEWGYGFAATQSGLYYKSGDNWKESAYKNTIVYDFLFTPHYLYIGLDHGISMYDRITDRWAAFELGFGVTALAATKDNLFGSTVKGELVVSNGQGGFSTIQFPDIFIFSVISKHARVYVCTDKGLYRIGKLGDRLTLFSVKPGVPVTDIDWLGTELYMATLSKGVQMMLT